MYAGARAIALAALLLALTAAPAAAVTRTWDGPANGGEWSTPENWSGDTLPQPEDDAVLGNGNVIALRGTSATVASLDSGSSRLVIEGVTLTLAGVGPGAVRQTDIVEGGSLVVSGTARFFGELRLGETAGAPTTGAISVQGTVNGPGVITEAGAGLGSVRVEPTGTLRADGLAPGHIFSRFENDGAFLVEASLTVGPSAGSPVSDGSFDIVDVLDLRPPAGSTFTFGAASSTTSSNPFRVGSLNVNLGGLNLDLGGGTVAVAPGASFTPSQVSIRSPARFDFDADGQVRTLHVNWVPGGLANTGGRYGAGTLRVTGPGGSVVQGGRFVEAGTTIYDGGLLVQGWQNDAARLAAAVAEGAVLRTNGDTQLDNGIVQVGNAGGSGRWDNAGAMTIPGDSRLENLGGGLLNNLAAGALSQTGASFGGAGPIANAGSISVPAGSTFGGEEGGAAGPLTQTGGQTSVASGATLNRNVAVQGGTLKGNGTVRSIDNSGGTVEAGASPGTLTVTGPYSQGANGTLRTEIAGTTPGSEFDVLSVGGAATLGGTLAIANEPAFTPALVDEFHILASGSRTGQFATVTGDQAGARRYLPQYQADGVELCVTEGNACGQAAGPDADGDGVPDDQDNCSGTPNPGQLDTDSDGEGDACDSDDDNDGDLDAQDNCPVNHNPGQSDPDDDGSGNPCDSDDDEDGDADMQDNCPVDQNPGQQDTDGDGDGDACDRDNDNDGDLDLQDNCPVNHNPGQQDTDGDLSGNVCDTDDDNDGDADAQDNCPVNPNPGQQDSDGDGDGDACDPDGGGGGDGDGDGVPDATDNCPAATNPGQQNSDNDGLGDACDVDDDNDGDPDAQDNCPLVGNPEQQNADGDAQGDACDSTPGGDPPPPPPPAAPTAAFTWGPKGPCSGRAVAFDASGSTAGAAPIVSYRWVFSAVGPETDVVSKTTTSPGVFQSFDAFLTRTGLSQVTYRRPPSTVTLTVTDRDGRTAETRREVDFTNPISVVSVSLAGGQTSPALKPCPESPSVDPTLVLSVLPKPSSGPALVQGGTLVIPQGCPSGGRVCGAAAVANVVSRLIPGDPCRRLQPGDPCRRVAAGAQRRRSIRVAKPSSVLIRPGRRGKLKLKLNRRGRALLRSRRLRRVRVTYAPFVVGRKPKTTTRVVRVRQRSGGGRRRGR